MVKWIIKHSPPSSVNGVSIPGLMWVEFTGSLPVPGVFLRVLRFSSLQKINAFKF